MWWIVLLCIYCVVSYFMYIKRRMDLGFTGFFNLIPFQGELHMCTNAAKLFFQTAQVLCFAYLCFGSDGYWLLICAVVLFALRQAIHLLNFTHHRIIIAVLALIPFSFGYLYYFTKQGVVHSHDRSNYIHRY